MFAKGDEVKVHLPSGESAVTMGMRHFNKVETAVSRVHHIKNGWNVYELYGCVSTLGVPFTFIDEWLIPLEEEVAI